MVIVGVAGAGLATSGMASRARGLTAVRPAPLQVRYTGGATVRIFGRLVAVVGGRRAVAAVTFELDGHAVASDATAPYTVTLLPGDARLGRHVLRVVAVLRDGSHVSSRMVGVTVARARRAVRVASPRRGFGDAVSALARGGAVVRLLPGDYRNVSIKLGPGSILLGDGGAVLHAPAGPYASVLFVAGDGVLVSGVAIEGAGEGEGAGHAVEIGPSRGVVLRRLRVTRTRVDGVNVWGKVDDASIQDSSFDGAGTAAAGVVAAVADADDVSVIRTRIRRFREFGINFAQSGFGRIDRGRENLALDNVISDISAPIDTQGRSQGAIWSGGPAATIVGNRIHRIGWDGIETVGTSDGVVIARNHVSETRTGVYLEHQTTRSRIVGNSISDVFTGINVEWRYGGIGSYANVFSQNRIARARGHGIFIDTGSYGNLVTGNVIDARTGTAVVLQGSYGNSIIANHVCGGAKGIVQQTGLAEDGTPIAPTGNRLVGNFATARCGR